MALNLSAIAHFRRARRSSLRAERGNPVMKPARSAVFEPRTLKDAHWIATSPAAPRNEQGLK